MTPTKLMMIEQSGFGVKVLQKEETRPQNTRLSKNTTENPLLSSAF